MAIKTYTKDKATQLSTNFKSTEFDCNGVGCCSETPIDEQLVKYLQQIRTHFGKAVTICSSYRCPIHNAETPNASKNSRHMKGMAADIKVKDTDPEDVAAYAETIGVLGIGLYDTDKDGHFVHIDTRDYKSFWFGHAQEKRTTFQKDKKEEAPKEPEIAIPKKFKDGATVQLVTGAKYTNGKSIPNWVFDSILYARKTDNKGNVTISTLSSGAVTGIVHQDYLTAYTIPDVIPEVTTGALKTGDKVKLVSGATYFNGQHIPDWVFKKTLYVRGAPRANGDVVVSTVTTGPIIGVVNKKYLVLASASALYSVCVTASLLNIRESASSSSKIVGQTKKGDIHEVYSKKGNWLQTKLGWISTNYVKKA